MRLSFSMFAVSCTLLGTSLVNGTCARNPHMTGLHCIQVVDHFKRWMYRNRKELEMWRIELLCSVLGTHTITMPCYYHMFNCSTQLNLYCRQTDRQNWLFIPHTCVHRVTTTITQLHEKWEDNCRSISYHHYYYIEWLHNSKPVIMSWYCT